MLPAYPCCEAVRRVEAVPGDATTLLGGMCLEHGPSLRSQATDKEVLKLKAVDSVGTDKTLEQHQVPGAAESLVSREIPSRAQHSLADRGSEESAFIPRSSDPLQDPEWERIKNMSTDEVDAELRSAGADPVAVGDIGRVAAYLGKAVRFRWPGEMQQRELQALLAEVRADERNRTCSNEAQREVEKAAWHRGYVAGRAEEQRGCPDKAGHPDQARALALLVQRVGGSASMTTHDLQRAEQYQLRWTDDGHTIKVQAVSDT